MVAANRRFRDCGDSLQGIFVTSFTFPPRCTEAAGIIDGSPIEWDGWNARRMLALPTAVLVRSVLALTQADFNALVSDHAPALYRMAFRLTGDRHEAEDVVQETFRSAWSSRERYESGRGDRAWLAAILRRRVVDRWRRRPREGFGSGDPMEVETAGENPLAGEYTDEMQAALAKLPPDLRETLLLVVVGELTHQETADLLHIPLGTVLSRVSRARARMREYLVTSKSDFV